MGPRPKPPKKQPKRSPRAWRRRRERFVWVYFAPSDPFFRRNGLLYVALDELETLADRLAEAQPMLAILAEDPSLRGLAEVLGLAIEEAEGDLAAAVAPVLERLAETVEALAAEEPAVFSWRSVMTDAPIEDSDRRAFIQVKPVYEFGSLAPVKPALRVVEREAEALALTENEGYRLLFLGSAVLLQDELKSVRDGMGLVGLLSFVLVLCFLGFGLRSWRLILGTLASLLAGLIWTAAFATVAIGSLNLISVAFAVLFIGLSVDFGIHYSLRYREARRSGAAHGDALAEAAGGVGVALTLSATTAAIGFFSFLPTAYRGVSELGLISGVGMFIALFANLTVLPAMLTVLPHGGSEPARASGGLAAGFQSFIETRARAILAVAALLALAGLAALPFAWFDDDPFNLRDRDSPSMQALLELMEDPRVQPYDAELLRANLDDAATIAERFEALPEVDEARGLLDLVPGDQDDKLAVIDDMNLFLGPLFFGPAPQAPPEPAARRTAAERISSLASDAEGALNAPGERLAAALGRLPGDDESLRQLEGALLEGLPDLLDQLASLLEAGPVALEDLPEQLTRRYLAPDGQTRLEIIPLEDLHDRRARRAFVDAVLEVAPETTGTPVFITAGGRAVQQAFLEAGLYAFGAILLLLLLLLRSLRDSLLILAPLLLAALLTVAATVVLDQPFNFANVIVLPLLFGLGVAFGIQIVLRARLETGGRLLETSTPRAVTFSALTTIGSFCSLSISSHPGTASMGFLLTVAISLTLVCTLLVLPALLTLVARPRAPQGNEPAVLQPPTARRGIGVRVHHGVGQWQALGPRRDSRTQAVARSVFRSPVEG